MYALRCATEPPASTQQNTPEHAATRPGITSHGSNSRSHVQCILRLPLLIIALFVLIAVPVSAQSPNTATMIVVVEDQTGAALKDARVSIVNNATGASREAVSGTDGAATIPALSLTGTYT